MPAGDVRTRRATAAGRNVVPERYRLAVHVGDERSSGAIDDERIREQAERIASNTVTRGPDE